MTHEASALRGVTGADCHVPASAVRQLFGGISDMTLHRWLRDPNLNFPRPLVINHRRYWKRGAIDEWLAARETGAA